MASDKVRVQVLEAYHPEIAAGLGELMPLLDENFSGEPVDQTWLEDTISSESHAQLVAVTDSGQVVGAAALSLLRRPATLNSFADRRKVWLEDVIVHPDVRGTDVAPNLWDALVSWGASKGADTVNFLSEYYRVAAHRYYQKMGAVIVEDPATSIYEYTVPSEPSRMPEESKAFNKAEDHHGKIRVNQDEGSVAARGIVNVIRGTGVRQETGKVNQKAWLEMEFSPWANNGDIHYFWNLMLAAGQRQGLEQVDFLLPDTEVLAQIVVERSGAKKIVEPRTAVFKYDIVL